MPLEAQPPDNEKHLQFLLKSTLHFQLPNRHNFHLLHDLEGKIQYLMHPISCTFMVYTQSEFSHYLDSCTKFITTLQLKIWKEIDIKHSHMQADTKFTKSQSAVSTVHHQHISQTCNFTGQNIKQVTDPHWHYTNQPLVPTSTAPMWMKCPTSNHHLGVLTLTNPLCILVALCHCNCNSIHFWTIRRIIGNDEVGKTL